MYELLFWSLLAWLIGYLMGFRVSANVIVKDIEKQGSFVHKGEVYHASELVGVRSHVQGGAPAPPKKP